MRTKVMIAVGMVAGLTVAGTAQAQRIVQRAPGATYGVPGARPVPPTVHAPRWGSKVEGRWWGGSNAPGGWRAYRRPTRGYALPTYWNAPRFYINDWSTYGLARPPQGYRWTRYYDDAVLIDGRGSVYDSMSAVDWDRYDDAGYYAGDDVAYDADRAPPPLSPQAGRDYARPGFTQVPPPVRRDTGVGGAAIGAVAGGVAGNVIAGRGNRLGGTLIGAGVGAATGYAIDKAEDRGAGDRGRRMPPPPRGYDAGPDGYGANYDVPMAPDGPPPPYYGDRGYADAYRTPPAMIDRGNGRWTSADGQTTVVTTQVGGNRGYGAPVVSYGPGGTTTVTVQNAPSVTTTTTTTYEDVVSYSRPRTRTVYTKARGSKLVRR